MKKKKHIVYLAQKKHIAHLAQKKHRVNEEGRPIDAEEFKVLIENGDLIANQMMGDEDPRPIEHSYIPEICVGTQTIGGYTYKLSSRGGYM